MDERADREDPDLQAAAGLRGRLPDLLTGSRLALGPLFVLALPVSAGVAFLLALLAAATDFVDGKLARRFGGGSTRGAILDVLGDAVFVLSGLFALAAVGTLSWALPIASLLSLSALARAWWSHPPRPGSGGRRGVPDWIGHTAGILNYGAVCVGSGFMAFGISLDLLWASRGVAVVNVLPIALRWFESTVSGPASRS